MLGIQLFRFFKLVIIIEEQVYGWINFVWQKECLKVNHDIEKFEESFPNFPLSCK